MKAVKYKMMLKALRQSLASLSLEGMNVDKEDYRLVRKKITKRIMENKK